MENRRRGRDSNPRDPRGPASFQDWCVKPDSATPPRFPQDDCSVGAGGSADGELTDPGSIIASSAPASGDLAGFGQSAQVKHGREAEERSGREEGEGPTPADRLFEKGDQPDAERSQQEAQRQLHG